MVALDRTDVPYLIFVPKNGAVKKALSPMRSGDMRTVEHKFTFNRDRTTIRSETAYALLPVRIRAIAADAMAGALQGGGEFQRLPYRDERDGLPQV